MLANKSCGHRDGDGKPFVFAQPVREVALIEGLSVQRANYICGVAANLYALLHQHCRACPTTVR